LTISVLKKKSLKNDFRNSADCFEKVENRLEIPRMLNVGDLSRYKGSAVGGRFCVNRAMPLLTTVSCLATVPSRCDCRILGADRPHVPYAALQIAGRSLA
jgi:hypothetical protein